MQNYAAMTAYLKTNYVDNNHLYDQFLGIDPLMARILAQNKSGQCSGESVTVPIAVARSQAMSHAFASARSVGRKNNSATKKAKFIIPFDTDVHSVGFITHKAKYASKDGQGAFVDAVEDETKSVIDSLKSRYSKDIYGDGSGSIGRVQSVSGKEVILTNFSDLWYMDGGVFCDFYDGKGASATKRDGSANEIVKIDEVTKTITFNGDLTGVVANDYIFREGDGNSANGIDAFVGLGGWLPEASPSDDDSFYNVNRSNYPTRLSGWRVNALSSNGSVLDTIRRGMVMMSKFYRNSPGKDAMNIPTDIFLGSAAWEVLADEYDTDTELRRMNSEDLKTGVKGFEGLIVRVAGKALNAWSCPALNPLVGYILNPGHWRLKWLGGAAKHPVSFQTMTNGTYFKDTDDGAEIEFRMQSHPVMYCEAPGLQVRMNFNNIKSDIEDYLKVGS